MPFFYYWDPWYFAVIAAVLFSVWASARVNSAFKAGSRVRPMSGMTGYDAAYQVLRANGVDGVRIEHVQGNLTDHYDPRSRVLRLSDNVYGVSSAAAIGVAAHEAGHAIQHAHGYAPLTIRNAIIPITNFGSKIAIPLVLLGILFEGLGRNMIVIAYAGVACFALSVLFQLLTLPTEFNASRRALNAIESGGMLSREELGTAKSVLTAAALTYVAALTVALTQFLRLLGMVQRRDRR
ncbi:MAG: zinc metallopeptidase [Ruminococcaceae bacterium]|nr:zinc metallopeptidase [Oscillospiraceae bacterium]